MNINEYQLLEVVKKFRDANDRSRFEIEGEVKCSDLTASVSDCLAEVGWEANERALAKIDTSFGKVKRLLVFSSRGIYIYAGEGAAEELVEKEMDGAVDSEFISWDQMSACTLELGVCDSDTWMILETPDGEGLGWVDWMNGFNEKIEEFILDIRKVATSPVVQESDRNVEISFAPRVITDKTEINKLLDSFETTPGSCSHGRVRLMNGDQMTGLGLDVLKTLARKVTVFPLVCVTHNYKYKKEWRQYEEQNLDMFASPLYPGESRTRKIYTKNSLWDDSVFLPLYNNENGEVDATCRIESCNECNGNGYFRKSRWVRGNKLVKRDCPACNREGMVGIYVCERCGGRGVVEVFPDVKEEYKKECAHCNGKGKIKTVIRAKRKVTESELGWLRTGLVSPRVTSKVGLSGSNRKIGLEDFKRLKKRSDFKRVCRIAAKDGGIIDFSTTPIDLKILDFRELIDEACLDYSALAAKKALSYTERGTYSNEVIRLYYGTMSVKVELSNNRGDVWLSALDNKACCNYGDEVFRDNVWIKIKDFPSAVQSVVENSAQKFKCDDVDFDEARSYETVVMHQGTARQGTARQGTAHRGTAVRPAARHSAKGFWKWTKRLFLGAIIIGAIGKACEVIGENGASSDEYIPFVMVPMIIGGFVFCIKKWGWKWGLLASLGFLFVATNIGSCIEDEMSKAKRKQSIHQSSQDGKAKMKPLKGLE